jgi:hypothetical protein
MKLAILVTFALLCGTARAAEWVALATAGDGGPSTSVDISAIAIAGDLRTVAFRSELSDAHVAFVLQDRDGRAPSFYGGRAAFNCGSRTFQMREAILFYADGTSSDVEPSEPPAWEPLDAEGLRMMRFVCGWRRT